jgi:tetratricopeptide (TPR) repeat protein
MRARHAIVCCLFCPIGACAPAARPPRAAPVSAPSAQALFERGRAMAAQGDGNRAEQYLTLALRAGYPEEQVVLPLVELCIAACRLRAALDHLDPFLRRHPEHWQLRYLGASIRLALGHQSEAAAELQRVVRQHPDAARAHYLLGVIERDAFRDEQAARISFERYVARDPRGVFAPEAQAWLAEHPRSGADEPRPLEATP